MNTATTTTTDLPFIFDAATKTVTFRVTRDHVLTVDTGRGYYASFGVGHIARGDAARQETGGALVPGPWAYAYELATAIDDHGVEAAERLRRRQRGLEIEAFDGMRIEIDCEVYTCRIQRQWGEIELHLERN